MASEHEVIVATGSLRSRAEGVTVEAPFTGAHLLHLAAALHGPPRDWRGVRGTPGSARVRGR